MNIQRNPWSLPFWGLTDEEVVRQVIVTSLVLTAFTGMLYYLCVANRKKEKSFVYQPVNLSDRGKQIITAHVQALLNFKELGSPVELHSREHREIRPGERKGVPVRLKTQFDRAQEALKAEENENKRGLDDLSVPLQTTMSELKRCGDWEVGIAQRVGKSKQGIEDLIVCDTITVNGEKIPLFAVCDGHGGVGAARFVQQNLAKTLKLHLEKRLPTTNGVWNALKQTPVDLHKQFLNSKEFKTYWSGVQSNPGDSVQLFNQPSFQSHFTGTTLAFSIIYKGYVWGVNLGDSRIILDNGDETIALSKDMKASDPRIKKRIEKRGGTVIKKDTWRIASSPEVLLGSLAPGGSIGDPHIGSKMSARPWIIHFPIDKLKENARLILVSDGITDAGKSKQITAIASLKDRSKEEAARIVSGAYLSGAPDDLTAMVVHL